MKTEHDHLKWFSRNLPGRFFDERMQMIHLKSGGQVVASIAVLGGKSYAEFFFGSSANGATHEGTILESSTDDPADRISRILASLKRRGVIQEGVNVG